MSEHDRSSGKPVPIAPSGSVKRALDSTTGLKKRKNVTVACSGCRKRRTKCDGRRPCAGCEQAQLPCIYETEADKRTTEYKQQNIGEFENDSNYLHLLIERIRTGDGTHVAELAGLIRASKPHQEIRAWLTQSLTATSNMRSWADKHTITLPSLDSVHSSDLNTSGASSLLLSSKEKSEAIEMEIEPQIVFDTLEDVSMNEQSSHSSHIHQDSTEAFHEVLEKTLRRHAVDSQQWHPALCTNFSSDELLGFPKLSGETSIRRMGARNPNSESRHADSREHLQAPSDSHVPRGLDWASDIQTNGYPWAIQQQQLRILEQPEWSILPLSFDDQSPLCRTYISFWRAARMLIAKGVPFVEIIGDQNARVDLFFVSRRYTDAHNVSNWASSVMASFVEFEAAARLRSVLLYYQLMRWLIKPCPETYNQLSIYQRPTIAQRLIPHSAVIDLVHEAEVRTGLCQNPRDFLTPAKGVSVNWPKPIQEAVTYHGDGSLVVTQQFQIHALNRENWTYPESYLMTFPELEGLVKINDP